MTRFAVVMPVGPDPKEAERAEVLLASLRRHEPGAAPVVLVDDAPAPRTWDASVEVVPNPRRGRGWGTLGGLCAGVLAGLAAVPADVGFVLRIDTDALVVAPFAARVAAALAGAPDAGLAGSYDDAGSDGRRDWDAWIPVVKRVEGPRGLVRAPHARRVLRRARAAGWSPGESCLGAACVLAPRFVDAIRGERPLAWLRAGLGDDVMLGALARAHGFTFLSLTGADGPLAVSHVGLNASPEAIRASGRAIVHSVRNDPRWSEDELRRRLLA